MRTDKLYALGVAFFGAYMEYPDVTQSVLSKGLILAGIVARFTVENIVFIRKCSHSGVSKSIAPAIPRHVSVPYQDCLHRL